MSDIVTIFDESSSTAHLPVAAIAVNGDLEAEAFALDYARANWDEEKLGALPQEPLAVMGAFYSQPGDGGAFWHQMPACAPVLTPVAAIQTMIDAAIKAHPNATVIVPTLHEDAEGGWSVDSVAVATPSRSTLVGIDPVIQISAVERERAAQHFDMLSGVRGGRYILVEAIPPCYRLKRVKF